MLNQCSVLVGSDFSRNDFEDSGFFVMLPLQHEASKFTLGEEKNHGEESLTLKCLDKVTHHFSFISQLPCSITWLYFSAREARKKRGLNKELI